MLKSVQLSPSVGGPAGAEGGGGNGSQTMGSLIAALELYALHPNVQK